MYDQTRTETLTDRLPRHILHLPDDLRKFTNSQILETHTKKPPEREKMFYSTNIHCIAQFFVVYLCSNG